MVPSHVSYILYLLGEIHDLVLGFLEFVSDLSPKDAGSMWDSMFFSSTFVLSVSSHLRSPMIPFRCHPQHSRLMKVHNVVIPWTLNWWSWDYRDVEVEVMCPADFHFHGGLGRCSFGLQPMYQWYWGLSSCGIGRAGILLVVFHGENACDSYVKGLSKPETSSYHNPWARVVYGRLPWWCWRKTQQRERSTRNYLWRSYGVDIDIDIDIDIDDVCDVCEYWVQLVSRDFMTKKRSIPLSLMLVYTMTWLEQYMTCNMTVNHWWYSICRYLCSVVMSVIKDVDLVLEFVSGLCHWCITKRCRIHVAIVDASDASTIVIITAPTTAITTVVITAVDCCYTCWSIYYWNCYSGWCCV